MAQDNNIRISVSHEALRSELLSLELRLNQTLATKGELITIQHDISEQDKRLNKIERYSLTKEDIINIIQQQISSSRLSGWKLVFAVIGVLAVIGNFILLIVNSMSH